MNTKNTKAITLLSFLTVLIAFFISPSTSIAATVNHEKVADYVSTWRIKAMNNKYWVENGIHMIKANNEPAFCIEHGVDLNGGSGFNPTELTIPEKERLSLIAYYGYQLNPTIENYGITQNLVWLEFGDTLLSTQIPNFEKRKKEILDQVNTHNIKPSFHNQTITLKIGESITLEDKNNVLEKYGKQLSNSANLKIEKKGNKIKLTATKDSKETGNVKYSIASQDSVGQSFVYAKEKEQKVATFKLSAAGEFNLNVKVKQNGNVKVKKIDEDTNSPLPKAKLKFEYEDKIKEIITDEKGIAQINDINEGTLVTISEVTAPDGFFNQGELKKVKIEANKTIEITLNNKPQKGQLTLNKLGNIPIGIKKEKSKYGDLYQFIFDYQPVSGVTYEINAAEDIKVGSTTHFKKGDHVATVLTGDDGHLIDMPLLYLGKYEAIEIAAPSGFIVDSTPIPFEFSYEGQTIELVSRALSAKNEFQKLKLTLHKNEEILKEWKENKPIIDLKPADNKVFGLYTDEAIPFSEQEIPRDSLINFGTIKEGLLILDNLQYPEGKYYFKEIDAGNLHDVNPNNYPFTFKAEDNDSTKEISIFENSDDKNETTPLLNKLHFNKFQIKKINEQAKLTDKKGYEFTYDGSGEKAEFVLEDKNGKVLQTVTINKDSLGLFENIPVGTFYLKETTPSSNHYVPLNSKIKIESTKEGIIATDEKGNILGEQKDDGKEISVLINVKNDLIKGNTELTKVDVSSGEPLPNTDIRILDEDKNCVVEGKTDNKGILIFNNLPKGIYYFQEIGAPDGYQLDDTPITFEIKEEGKTVKCKMTNKKNETSTTPLPQTSESKTTGLFVIGTLLLTTTLIIIDIKTKRRTTESKD